MRSDLRAIFRVARRDRAESKRTNVALVLLVALPVAFTTWGLTIAQTVNPSANDLVNATIGRADLHGVNPDQASLAALPNGSSVETLYRSGEVVSWGASGTASVELQRTLAPAPLDASRLRLSSGRHPARKGEVTISPSLRRDGARIGQSLNVDGRRFKIVGVAYSPTQRNEGVVRAFDDPAWKPTDQWVGFREILVTLPTGLSPSAEYADTALRVPAFDPSGTESRRFDTRSVLVAQNRFVVDRSSVSLLAGSVPMVEIGLIVAAIYSVTLERRRRLLQLLSAQGATTRQGLVLLLSDALFVGAVGAMVGVAIGLGIAALFRLWLQRSLPFVAGGLRFSVFWVALGAFLAVVATMVAALRPAKNVLRESMATVPRSDVRRRPASPARIGAGVAVAVSALVAAVRAEDNAKTVLTIVGAVASTVTAGAIAQHLVTFASRHAAKLPVWARLALRELTRKKDRTTALSVALVSALCGCVAVVSVLHSDEQERKRQYRPSLERNQILTMTQNPAASDAIARALPAGRRVDFLDAFVPYGSKGLGASDFQIAAQPLGVQAWVVPREHSEKFRPGTIGVISESSLKNLGLEAHVPDLRAGKLVLLATGYLKQGRVVYFGGRSIAAVEPKGSTVPSRYNIPVGVLSAEAATSMGLKVSRKVSSTIFVLDHDITAADLVNAVPAARRFNEVLTWERGFRDSTRSLRVGVIVFITLLALALVALIAALVLGESVATLATLRMLGARSSLRRAQGATLTGIVTLVSMVLAVPIGLAITKAVVAPSPFAAPTLLILSLGVSVTTLAVLGGALFARGQME